MKRNTSAGFTLLEMLAYIGVLFVFFGASYAFTFRCMKDSTGLRRATEDIADVLQVGENWRADVRAASRIQLETAPNEQVLHLPGSRGDIAYRFAENSVSRRVANNDWAPLLTSVQTSTFTNDLFNNVSLWRWEVELQPRAKKPGSRPMFTFMAVPSASSGK